jgi:hypothetical protein
VSRNFRKTDPYESTPTKHDEEKANRIVSATTTDELKSTLNQHGDLEFAHFIDQIPNKTVYYFQLIYLTRYSYVGMNAYTHSISCWHENQTESDAMWALYAGRNAGIAVKSTVTRVLEAFASSERVMSIAKVTYDTAGTLSALTSGVYDSILIKRHAFHHENEVRIISLTLDGYESPEWAKENQRYNEISPPPTPPAAS